MLPMLLIVVIAIVVPLFFVFVFGISGYNKLVALRNGYKNGFAQIDVQLKRRYDLIPNVVETARKYVQHERDTLEAVIAARNSARGAADAARARPTDAAVDRRENTIKNSFIGSTCDTLLSAMCRRKTFRRLAAKKTKIRWRVRRFR